MGGIAQGRKAKQADRSRRGGRGHLLEFTMMDVIHAASDSRQPFRDARGQGSIVFDPAQLRQATPALFDPASYGADAQAVRGLGGRGAAWFVRGPFGEGVLRHYRRGGWAARASERSYLWQGEGRVRSLREYALLDELRALGLPVPAPIAACYQRQDFRYRAAIIVRRIAEAHSFAALVAERAEAAPWSEVGRVIGRFHRQYAHHADLNAHNVLLDAGHGAWLIDWDKGRIEPGAGSWRQRVVDRLHRSLRKECPGLTDAQLVAGMQLLQAAHDQEQVP